MFGAGNFQKPAPLQLQETLGHFLSRAVRGATPCYPLTTPAVINVRCLASRAGRHRPPLPRLRPRTMR